MQYVREQVFPTELYCFDNVLEPEQNETMSKYIYETEDKNKKLGQSVHTLHQLKTFRPLTLKVLEASKIYFDNMNYIYDDFVITGMWSNILRKGEYFKPHTHSNNILSGVFYTKSDMAAAIQFTDPRPQVGVFYPDVKEWTKSNSSLWYFPSTQNRMILFPSWLQHHVPVNESNNDRISIAFNVMLKGTIGSYESYQGAEV